VSHDNSSGAQTASGYRLSIPNVTPDMHVLDAARAYATAGWYVVPIRRGTKHPGSVVGENWQRKSSRTNTQLEEWWARTDYGIALHVGRSGALVFDVDVPSRIPDVLRNALETYAPPYQSTRTNVSGKGHYVFTTDGHYGNSPGNLGLAWGEVRGKNGIIVVSPSVHESAEDGGHYCWQRIGPVPDLPLELAEQLPGTADPSEVATDAEVRMFADSYVTDMDRGLLIPVMQRFDRDINDGGSRHGAMVTAACWAARESAAGAYPALKARNTLRRKFIEVMRRSRMGSSRVLSEHQAGAEFDGIWAWAVSQAMTADITAVRERIEATPRPDRGLAFDPPPTSRTSAEPGGSPGDTAPSDDDRSTWLPVDLGPYLDGTYVAIEPGIVHRADGIGMFYPGRVHWAHGESESGKSWIAQIAAMAVMASGGPVIYLDHESDPLEVIGRFRALGADNDMLTKQLAYIRPDSSARNEANWEAFTALLESQPLLIVIDGVTDALGLDHVSSKDTDEVASWVRAMPRRLAAATGAAVICIDHVTKDADDRGRYMIGSQAKMNGIDGSAYLIEPIEPMGRGLVGEIAVRIAKDRPGSLRPHAGTYRRSDRTQEFARVIIDSTDPTALAVTINGPSREDTELEAWIKRQALAAMGTDYTSANRLLEAARDDGIKFKQTATIKRDSMELYRQWCERRVAFNPGSVDGSEV
jgi:Bifunctional DNA primase/polymerase, N-terminal/AAA domain